MTSLISLIPSILLNLVVGYCFIYIMNLVLLNKNEENVEHSILKSFVIGYIYCLIAHMIPFSINTYADNICIIVSSIIVAYFIGKFIRSQTMLKILDFLKIQKNRNQYVWNELLDKEYSMIVRMEYTDKIYEGYVHANSDFSDTPMVALCLCEIKDKDGNIIEDNKNKVNEVVLLDASKANSVTFIYDSHSAITDDIKKFL